MRTPHTPDDEKVAATILAAFMTSNHDGFVPPSAPLEATEWAVEWVFDIATALAKERQERQFK